MRASVLRETGRLQQLKAWLKAVWSCLRIDGEEQEWGCHWKNQSCWKLRLDVGTSRVEEPKEWSCSGPFSSLTMASELTWLWDALGDVNGRGAMVLVKGWLRLWNASFALADFYGNVGPVLTLPLSTFSRTAYSIHYYPLLKPVFLLEDVLCFSPGPSWSGLLLLPLHTLFSPGVWEEEQQPEELCTLPLHVRAQLALLAGFLAEGFLGGRSPITHRWWMGASPGHCWGWISSECPGTQDMLTWLSLWHQFQLS